MIDTIKARLEQIKRTLPPDIQIEVIRDNSRFIKASINSLVEHLLFGSILASLVVLLFIRNWRAVVIASIAIPTSIIAAFTVIKFLDFTLNNMTLLALTLSLGIVIDDAIVVLENIFRYVEEKHVPAMAAAVVATKEIGLAVMATTLSLVIIFLPVAFITGYAKRFLFQFGITMAVAVAVSLLVSFTLTPMLASRWFRKLESSSGKEEKAKASGRGSSKEIRFFTFIDRHYGRMLEWSLEHKLAIVAISIAVMLTVIPLNKLVGRDWIPADDQSEFEIIFDTPEGTSLAGTVAVAKRMEKGIWKLPGVEHVRPSVQERVNHTHMYVRLLEPRKRKFSVWEVSDQARSFFPQFEEYNPRVQIPSALGGGESINYAIQLSLMGPEFSHLVDFARNTARELKAAPELQDQYVSVWASNPEIHVKVNREEAADQGIRAADINSALRQMVSGQDAISTYSEGDEQYDVKMLLEEKQRSDLQVLSRLVIPSATKGQVRLDSFATLERGFGPTQMNRYRRQYSVSVFSNLAQGMTVDRALPQVRQAIQKAGIPPGYGYRFTGQVKNLEETTGNIILAVLLAFVFVYMVLAAQFESLLYPFIIMLALPLSIPFALLTLYLTGRTLNLWSALGVLLLFGIVKKNGILQIDYTNRLRAQGKGLHEAIIEANHVRLRPILMTTAAIVAGLIPTALATGEGSQQRAAIAVTIIGGQTLCLLLTLLLTPVAYSLFADLVQLEIWAKLRLSLSRWIYGFPGLRRRFGQEAQGSSDTD